MFGAGGGGKKNQGGFEGSIEVGVTLSEVCEARSHDS